MKSVLLFIDDDAAILDAVGPLVRINLAGRLSSVVELQSIAEVQKFVDQPADRFPIIAIVDLWFNDFTNNTSDQDAGFKIIKLLRHHWPKIYVVIFSAHLNRTKVAQINKDFPDIAVLSKGEASLDSLFRAIEDGLRARTAS